jgi:hypothetical protein
MTEVLLAPAVAFAGVWLLALALCRPRFITYVIFALAPTQFLFIPVSNFFISPADVVVAAAGVSFMARLVAGEPAASRSMSAHFYIILMVAAYLLGFVVLGVFSRTLIRVAMAIVPSLLACEVLRERRHFVRAATALIIAGVVDAAYGLIFYAIGRPLYPGRFSGMSSTNFSATVIVTAAAIAFAQIGAARRWVSLLKPGVLLSFGLATLSQGGTLAFGTSWLTVLRRVMRRRNVLRIVAASSVAVILALSLPAVRERLVSRNEKTVEIDGVARNSADVRLMVLRSAWGGFSGSPVVGLGYAQFPAYSIHDPEIDASTSGQGYGTHDTYIEILVEGGLLAFACFVMHFAQFFPGLRSILWDVARQKDGPMGATLVGLPIVLVAAVFANMLLHYHFWAVCGLALAYIRIRRAAWVQALYPGSLVPSAVTR